MAVTVPGLRTSAGSERRLLRDVMLALVVKAALLGLLWRLFFVEPQSPGVDASGTAGQLAILPKQGGNSTHD